MAGKARITNELEWLGCRNPSQETHILGRGLAGQDGPWARANNRQILTDTTRRRAKENAVGTQMCQAPCLDFSLFCEVRIMRPHLWGRENRLLSTNVARRGEGQMSQKALPPAILLFKIYIKSSHFYFSLATFQEISHSRRPWSFLSLAPRVLLSMSFSHCLFSHLSDS